MLGYYKNVSHASAQLHIYFLSDIRKGMNRDLLV